MILRLLIVDDDTSLCGHLKSFFERQQYEVQVAHDGLQALERVAQFHPHLMFLDIGLPGKSGIEVLREVKQVDPSVRVIMITGQTEKELMRQTKLLGADDYVTKPFTLEYLNGEVLDKLHKQLFHELRSTSRYLAIEREKMELVFGQVTEGVLLVDQQGLIMLANPVAEHTLGLGSDSTGTPLTRVFATFHCEPEGRLQHLDQEHGKAFDLTRTEPRYFVLEGRISPIQSRQKETYGYLLLFRDVTLERKADSAMHRFISLVSHKLRTPLVAIRAYPKLLMSDTKASPINDFQRRALETIQKQCTQMESMVNQLIAFSSLDPEELVRQEVAISDLVNEAIKFIPDEIMINSAQIHRGAGLSDLRVEVDPTLLQHAVRNLVDNAFKFGGRQLEIRARAQGADIVLEFQDDGQGIPPEDQERVFERFYQVEKAFCGQVPGAGLGLTMVKQTVEAHRGRVWIESRVGQGTTVFVQLPAARESGDYPPSAAVTP